MWVLAILVFGTAVLALGAFVVRRANRRPHRGVG